MYTIMAFHPLIGVPGASTQSWDFLLELDTKSVESDDVI